MNLKLTELHTNQLGGQEILILNLEQKNIYTHKCKKNRYFNPHISPETARACAMEVSNHLVQIAIDTIIGFVASGNYSLASFLGYTGFGFFTGMAKVYYECIARYIR